MLNPFNSLLIASGAAVLLYFLFWPRSGFFWRWKLGLRNTERIQIEDALKHLYGQEYQGLTCTLQSISGILSISGDQAAKLIVRLESQGLVKSQGAGFELTSEGRSYALRMIRAHRLWERYFADETGLAETEWHDRAEKLEHGMTDEEHEALAASVGNPSYDPHGDPIPTRHGKLPPKKGLALTDLQEGEFAGVIHIEDELNEIYSQLVAQGLHLGMRVQLLEKSPQRLRFVADGEENILAPVLAANVTVEPLAKEEEMAGPFETLVSLHVGQKGEVVRISKACRGQQRRRLMDLGVIPGTVIEVERRSASGDPRAYNIRDASIALRNTHAELIHIKRLEEAA